MLISSHHYYYLFTMNESGINFSTIFEPNFIAELQIEFDENDSQTPFMEKRIKKFTEPIYCPQIDETTIKTVTDLINEYEKSFWFSSYEQYITTINSPKSELVNYFEPDEINELIQSFPNKHVFARLDPYSTKSDVPNSLVPYSSAQQIYDKFKLSSKAQKYLTKYNVLVLREYVENISEYYEIRCFVQNNILRGISAHEIPKSVLTPTNIEIIKTIIKTFIREILIATEITCCSIDILLHKSLDLKVPLMLVEINSPCWLFASSGNFDLNNVAHVEILFGKTNEFIQYPVML